MKNKIFKNRGSALILAVIVLVNALFIVVAVSSISIVERRMSIKTRNTAPAFQAADSGIEYVLSQIGDDGTIGGICTDDFGTDGKCTITSSNLDNVEIYFLDGADQVITDGNTSRDSVRAIRSVGKFGEGGYGATRAIEVAIAATTAGITGGCELEEDAGIRTVNHLWGEGCKIEGTTNLITCQDAADSGYDCGKTGEDSSDYYCICVVVE